VGAIDVGAGGIGTGRWNDTMAQASSIAGVGVGAVRVMPGATASMAGARVGPNPVIARAGETERSSSPRSLQRMLHCHDSWPGRRHLRQRMSLVQPRTTWPASKQR
jgi:hypothetical protein